MAAISREQEHRQAEPERDDDGAHRVLAEDLEHPREQRDARAEEHRTDDVERMGVFPGRAIVR
jgi:hypothetical protein